VDECKPLALGDGACNLKCGRSACHVRIALAGSTRFVIAILVGRCKLKNVETSVERAWLHRLKLSYDAPLSNFAFKLNLRRYILGVTTGANTAGEISMEYKPPSSCWTQPMAYEVLDFHSTNVFQWKSVSAGMMPDMDCEDAKKASLLSLEYVAKPFCQAPEDFPGGLQSCVPTKPLCKEDVVNAVDAAIGAGIKTAAYEWSSVKVRRCRLSL